MSTKNIKQKYNTNIFLTNSKSSKILLSNAILIKTFSLDILHFKL